MLEIKNLTKRYDQLIIDNLSVTFQSTGLVIIVGESGCGKTTLLNIIGGIDRDYEGAVLFDHQDIKMIKNYCRKHIGFLFQNFNLINWLNVKENYYLPKFFCNIIFKRELDDREEKLELSNIKKKKSHVLSGGQKQRVAMMRALVKNVDILLCDEPTGSLDETNAKIIFDYLKREAKERLVIVITHNEQLAHHYSNDVFTMKNGKLIGKNRRVKDNNFYCRLKEKKAPLNLFKLAILQFQANFIRNMKIIMGIMMALLCIMVTFTLSGSFQYQIHKQLNNIFPNQLISIQDKSKKGFRYNDLIKLKDNQAVRYVYGEMRDYEFIGISLQSDYNIDKTIYVSDMTKQLKDNQIELGRKIKNDYEIVLSKTSAVHLDKDYQRLLEREIFGYYLHDEAIKRVGLKVVGISEENTILDTIYINELANIKHISDCFKVERSQLVLSIGMINLDNKASAKKSLKELENIDRSLEYKVAGEDISVKINDFLVKVKWILILFSSLAVVAACFLIGEVLYLSVVEKTKDIGIFKCLGASKSQLRILVLLESFIISSVAFLFSIWFFYQLINNFNHAINEIMNLHISEPFILVDQQLLGLIYLGTLFLGLLSSYFPACFASRIDPVKALKHQRY